MLELRSAAEAHGERRKARERQAAPLWLPSGWRPAWISKQRLPRQGLELSRAILRVERLLERRRGSAAGRGPHWSYRSQPSHRA